MKKIAKFEEAIQSECRDLRAAGINPTLFWAYQVAKDTSNDEIDFSEVIWDYDIEPIAQQLREEGIKSFTISSTFSSLIETLAAFEKQGFRMAGLTRVRARYSDWRTGEHALIDAIRLVDIR